MASYLRARQAGVQNDLSAGIPPGSFAPDELARYGINSQISCLAYEPVQSLLAVGTHESKYGPGRIYVFGARRVCRVFGSSSRVGADTGTSTTSTTAAGRGGTPGGGHGGPPFAASSIRHVAFVANRLVSLDGRGELALWDLDTGAQVAHSTYGRGVACLVTDPGLDWAFLGLQAAGDVSAYDLDRERPAAGWRLPNLWKARPQPGGGLGGGAAALAGVFGVGLVGMQLHPRDIGSLLIGYTHGAVIYSFKQDQATRFFEYVVPAGAPGGNGQGMDRERRPRLVRAVWHPTGTFVLTAHEDGSLVFWDPKDGRVVAARSIYQTRVNEPGAKGVKPRPLAPFGRIAWCCKQNPDDTALLIAGGHAVDDAQKGLTFLELGPTPLYATSSWEVLTNHFEAKRRVTLQIPPGAEVADFCLVPRSSPYYDGAQDPIAVLVLLTSGELVTLSFPSGYPISPTNMLHPSLSFVHPFVQKIAVATMPRERWLALTETRSQGEPILMGGGPANKRRRPGWDYRNILQVAHADGTVRMWDPGYDDEIENPLQLQVDVARALDRFEDVSVTALAMADATGEFAAGTRTGELVVYRWGTNRNHGRDAAKPLDPNPGGLSDISSRAEPSLKEGLQPLVLYEMMQGPVSAVAASDVGFVAAGSEGGFVSIIDLRGPRVILQAPLTEFIKEEKRSSFLRGHSSSSPSSSSASHKGPGLAAAEFPTVIEFGVLTLEGDGYSSIDCFVGTNRGHVVTFKILPAGQAYSAQLAGVAKVGGDRVVAVCPVNAENGQPAAATGPAVAGLREGRQVSGVLVAVTQTEVRVFKPPTAKGASKSFDDQLCDAARVAEFPRHGAALVAVFGDRTVRAYSLPALKEIGRAALPMLDPSRTISAVLSRTGELFGWTGPSELAVLSVWGSGGPLPPSQDALVNLQLWPPPPRPTISNLQWISGAQYVSPTDLDLLIGGEGRPPSKRMVAAAAAERGMVGAGAGGTAAAAGGTGAARAGAGQEGWGEYLSRQINERTEKLTIVDDAMDRLQDASQGWAEGVNNFVKKQKRDLVLGSVKKSLF